MRVTSHVMVAATLLSSCLDLQSQSRVKPRTFNTSSNCSISKCTVTEVKVATYLHVYCFYLLFLLGLYRLPYFHTSFQGTKLKVEMILFWSIYN